MTQACCTLALITLAAAQRHKRLSPDCDHEGMAGEVTVVEVAAHFVTAIRFRRPYRRWLSATRLFEVEHSEREPNCYSSRCSQPIPRKRMC